MKFITIAAVKATIEHKQVHCNNSVTENDVDNRTCKYTVCTSMR